MYPILFQIPNAWSMMSASARIIEIAIGVACLAGWLVCLARKKEGWLASALNMGAFLVGLHFALSWLMAERLDDGSLSATPITIFSFGVVIILAFFGASWWSLRQTRPLNIEDKKIFDWCFWLLVVGIIGSRLLYAYLNYDLFRDQKGEIFKIWNGGLVWYGGLVPGILVGTFLALRHKLPVLHVGDIGAAAAMFALGLGRWACLLAGDDYGRPIEGDAWYGIRFYNPDALVPEGLRGKLLHPAQMYMSIMCLWIFFVVDFIRRRARFAGQGLAWMLILYAVGRAVLIEPIRGDFVERNPGYSKHLASALVFRPGDNDMAISLQRGAKVKSAAGRTGVLLSDLELKPGEGGMVFAITDEEARRRKSGPFAGAAPNWQINKVDGLPSRARFDVDYSLRRRGPNPDPWYGSDLPVPPGYVSTSQWISIFIVIAGVLLLLASRAWQVPGYSEAVAKTARAAAAESSETG